MFLFEMHFASALDFPSGGGGGNLYFASALDYASALDFPGDDLKIYFLSALDFPVGALVFRVVGFCIVRQRWIFRLVI